MPLCEVHQHFLLLWNKLPWKCDTYFSCKALSSSYGQMSQELHNSLDMFSFLKSKFLPPPKQNHFVGLISKSYSTTFLKEWKPVITWCQQAVGQALKIMEFLKCVCVCALLGQGVCILMQYIGGKRPRYAIYRWAGFIQHASPNLDLESAFNFLPVM